MTSPPDDNTDTILRACAFSFHVGLTPILSHVSFSLRRGHFTSLIGPNGAGKSTLIKCIMRILTGGTGSITLAGRLLWEYSQRELARYVGYVPQGDNLPEIPFSVRRFVEMGRYAHTDPLTGGGAKGRHIIDRVMDQTDTTRLADRRFDTLSGDEHLLAFTAALAQEPELLLLDEPTAFLDYRQKADVLALLGQLSHGREVTVLAVTHDVNEAALFADDVLAMRDGKVVFAGTPDELMKPEVLQSIYDTSLLLSPHPETGNPIVVPRKSGFPA